MKTPATLIRNLLCEQVAFNCAAPEDIAPTGDTRTPAYVGHLPDIDDGPAFAIAVYDVPGFMDGRIMKTGEIIEKPGIQIKVRSSDYDTAYALVKKMQEFTDALKSWSYADTDFIWTVSNISRRTNLVTSGSQTGRNFYDSFSYGAIVTLRRTPV